MVRSDCYKLLAACFYEPDKNLLVEERVCENLCALLSLHAPEAGRAASAMALALQTLSQEQLSIDHAALFIGPFELLAAPYGSVYIDQGRRVMGDSTLAVLRFYQEEGLAVDVQEPADHIVIELELLSYLAGREASAMADGREEDAARCRERQLLFITRYLQPWIYKFCEAIRRGTTNTFYRSLADCLGGFLLSSLSRPMTASEPAGSGDARQNDAVFSLF